MYRARQIIIADVVGQRAAEFLQKVQKASAGPPWYLKSPTVVCVNSQHGRELREPKAEVTRARQAAPIFDPVCLQPNRH